MASNTRPRVFLDVNIAAEPVGRLTIELFTEHTPRTCDKHAFRQFCTGEHDGMTYAKTPFHRVIDDFMIQGGDIEKGDGTGTVSIYGGAYDDENLQWRDMDAAGLVCSANRGRDTNGSQFFITTVPCPHLNGKHTIFGRLVSGDETLQEIAKVDVDDDDRPLEPVLISRCGELERKKKKTSQTLAPPPSEEQAESRDRGRRRGSNSGDVEMENSPVPPSRPRQHRRTSDNTVDEGLRGRPRQRSGSHSPKRPLSPQHEEGSSEDRSLSALHKRKRSQSPSRHAEGVGNYERRRRSLPNQYAEEQRRKTSTEDEERYRPSPRRDDYRQRGGRKDGGGDRYRPDRNGSRREDGGRLGGGGGGYDDYDPPVKFKGRGVMKYRG